MLSGNDCVRIWCALSFANLDDEVTRSYILQIDLLTIVTVEGLALSLNANASLIVTIQHGRKQVPDYAAEEMVYLKYKKFI